MLVIIAHVWFLMEKSTLVYRVYLVFKNFHFWLKFKDKTFLVFFKKNLFCFPLMSMSPGFIPSIFSPSSDVRVFLLQCTVV